MRTWRILNITRMHVGNNYSEVHCTFAVTSDTQYFRQQLLNSIRHTLFHTCFRYKYVLNSKKYSILCGDGPHLHVFDTHSVFN